MTCDWKSPASLPISSLPPSLRELLLERGSLTRRLQRHFGTPIEVRIKRRYWDRPTPDEARLLGVTRQARAFIREVTLSCRGVPCVYARTVIPRATLRGRYRLLERLGNRPLGELLFSMRGMKRGPMRIARLGNDALLNRLAGRGGRSAAAPRWGRRSLFLLGGRPLIVYEIFVQDSWP